MKPLKILVISNLYPSKKNPFHGTFIKNFTDNLERQKEIYKLDKCLIKGRSFHLYTKIYKYIKFYTQILYYLTFHKYDIVYVHIITHAAIPLRIISVFRKLPLVFNIHGEDILTQTKLAAYFLSLVKPLLIQSKLIVVPSYFFLEKVKAVLPDVPTSKLFVSASGGIDTIFYEPQIRKSNTQLTIGYVSRIDRGKGWDVFLKAIKILQNKNINLQAILVGSGTEIQEMENEIKSLNLKDTTYLGSVPYKKLPPIYTNLDLFIFPTTLEESLGLVGLEAMACHTPVIGSRIGGLTDYIVDGKNGFFFEPGNEIDLAKKIELFRNLPEKETECLKKAAYQTALQYKSDVVAQKLYSQLKQISE